MSAHVATIGAIAFSGATLLLCLGALLAIWSDMQGLWTELDQQMDQFRTEADGLWADMLQMGAGTASNRARRQAVADQKQQQTNKQPGQLMDPNRQRRQGASSNYGGYQASQQQLNCKCQLANNCPPGPQGVPGSPGEAGLPGVPGKAGIPGAEAPDWHNGPLKGCFHCPFGPQGTPGEVGRPGIRGMRGPKGTPGMPGRDGVPGLPGYQGGEGESGKDGPVGKSGERGKDEEKPIGRKGPRGPPGEPGPEGARGDKGAEGAVGRPGARGVQGPPGFQGPPGSDGEEGGQGTQGKQGEDAAYCPCPNREGSIRGGGAAKGRGGEGHKGGGEYS